MHRFFLYSSRAHRRFRVCAAFGALLCVTNFSAAPSSTLAQEAPKEQKQGGQAAPPGPKTSPQAVNSPAYSPEQVQAGQALFAGQCSFCHGRDAAGGEGGPDLTASAVVAEDAHGEKIGQVVRNGRLDKGMPAFSPTDEQLATLVAFIHDRKAKAKEGRRRTVDVADLQTGNVEAGMRYFNGAGGCAKCHSPTGDLAGIAGKFQGLELLKRMLYEEEKRPAGGATAADRVPSVTVTLPGGQTVTGKLAYRDEFTIGLMDASGWYRSWRVGMVKFSVVDPLEAHVTQLRKYTDEDMHDVLAYLQTLR